MAVDLTLTTDMLEKIFYLATDDNIFIFESLFNKYRVNFNLSCAFDINAFLAQILSEIGPALIGVRENLNYSCKSLKIFSYYRNNPKEAQKDGRCKGHAANQVNIGNKAYGKRLGNGSISTGDGYMFRGGGFFQLTGRNHYTNIPDTINAKINRAIFPEMLVEKITSTYWGLTSAMAFWSLYCDHCSTIDCTTKAINYYTDSYQRRRDNYDLVVSVTNFQ